MYNAKLQHQLTIQTQIIQFWYICIIIKCKMTFGIIKTHFWILQGSLVILKHQNLIFSMIFFSYLRYFVLSLI